MKVWWNGTILDEEKALVSVFDRGFLYGDACFETLRVYEGKPAFWGEHLQRLENSLMELGIPFFFSPQQLLEGALSLIALNDLPQAVLRVQVTRGRGLRGYSTSGCDQPSALMSVHPLPARAVEERPSWRLKTSTLRIEPSSPLNQHKSSNKLFQILATQEAEQAGFDDVMILTTDDIVAETSCANLFWIDGQTICTPPLSAGVLPGVTRKIVLNISRDQGWAAEERLIKKSELLQQDGVFLTQSVCEIVSVSAIDGCQLKETNVVDALRAAYRARAAGAET